jgi:hypothetical protein
MKALHLFRTTHAALVALCLVALQLVTALHFALVPHAFSAGLSGFVHVHAQAERASQSRFEHAPRMPGQLQWVSGGASCASESCPIGFAGQHSLRLGGDEAAALLSFATAPAFPRAERHIAARVSVLLSAPKTSPPG